MSNKLKCRKMDDLATGQTAALAMHTALLAQVVACRKNSDTARAKRQEKRNREKTLLLSNFRLHHNVHSGWKKIKKKTQNTRTKVTLLLSMNLANT